MEYLKQIKQIINIFCLEQLKIICLIIITLIISGCYKPGEYYYTRNESQKNYKAEISVWIDPMFGMRDQVEIVRAINSWNYAMNGIINISLVGTTSVKTNYINNNHLLDNKVSYLNNKTNYLLDNTNNRSSYLTNQDNKINHLDNKNNKSSYLNNNISYYNWKIYKTNGRDKDIPKTDDKHWILGWANYLGGNKIYLVRERMRNEDVYGLTLHEIGHLMGAEHDGVGLMEQYYHKNYLCINRETMEQVEKYWKISIEDLNYCKTN